jgi:hypothetical protein
MGEAPVTFSVDLDRALKAARWLVLLGFISYCALAAWHAMEQYSIHPMSYQEVPGSGVHHRLDRIDKELEDLDSRVTALEDE